jgi:hypothetical protein
MMKFKNFKIVRICLMIKVKVLARKLLYFNTLNTYEKREGSGSGSAQEHTNPTDPDPEHCLHQSYYLLVKEESQDGIPLRTCCTLSMLRRKGSPSRPSMITFTPTADSSYTEYILRQNL